MSQNTQFFFRASLSLNCQHLWSVGTLSCWQPKQFWDVRYFRTCDLTYESSVLDSLLLVKLLPMSIGHYSQFIYFLRATCQNSRVLGWTGSPYEEMAYNNDDQRREEGNAHQNFLWVNQTWISWNKLTLPLKLRILIKKDIHFKWYFVWLKRFDLLILTLSRSRHLID